MSMEWIIIIFWLVPAFITDAEACHFWRLKDEGDLCGMMAACGFGWPIVIIVMLCERNERKRQANIEKSRPNSTNRTSFDPIRTGFPPTLKKKYWEHPSETVGRRFNTPDGMYYVISWTPLDHGTDAGDDTLEDAGTMTVERCVAK
jgi:hypothetical protein